MHTVHRLPDCAHFHLGESGHVLVRKTKICCCPHSALHTGCRRARHGAGDPRSLQCLLLVWCTHFLAKGVALCFVPLPRSSTVSFEPHESPLSLGRCLRAPVPWEKTHEHERRGHSELPCSEPQGKLSCEAMVTPQGSTHRAESGWFFMAALLGVHFSHCAVSGAHSLSRQVARP